MIIEGNFNFGTPAITNSNTATISTNYFDAGSAKLVFPGETKMKLYYNFAVSSDCTGALIDFRGADNTAGTSNPSIIAATGNLTYDRLGAALGTGTQYVSGSISVGHQKVAKRYYSCFLTLAGTNPDSTAGDAFLVLDAQSNMLNEQAAAPST